MGTGFLPFLYRSPASSDTRLFFTRITTTPSGINVKLILSPVFIPRLSRIGLGIVVCPLLVSVASVLMVSSIVLRPYKMNYSKDYTPKQACRDNSCFGLTAALMGHFGGHSFSITY